VGAISVGSGPYVGMAGDCCAPSRGARSADNAIAAQTNVVLAIMANTCWRALVCLLTY
jgi:hypothetical protein